MTIVEALVLARWTHFMAAAILFGALLFPFYALPGREPAFLPHRTAVFFASAATAISGGLWLALTIVNMTGEPDSLLDGQLWQSFFFETGFGVAWLIRLAILAAIIAVASFSRPGLMQSALMIALGGSLLIDQAWLGHAAAAESWIGVIAIVVYALHVLAASVWIGGLLPLAIELAHLMKPGSEGAVVAARTMLWRFSSVGMAAVLIILASGIVNTVLRIDSWRAFFETDYGRILSVKLGLFAVMLVVAGINRFELMPRMLVRPTSVRSLHRNVLLELLLGAVILAAAAALGLQPPPA